MVKTTSSEFTSLLLVSIKKLTHLKAEGYNVNYRFYDIIPAFGLQIIQAKKASRIYVELYTLCTDLKKRISFPVNLSNSGEMYKRFQEQFDALWDDSHELDDPYLKKKIEILFKAYKID